MENLQREDLNPVDEALAYQRLVDEFGLTQDQIAAAVGKDRTSVANYLRLLRLPDEVRGDLAAGSLSMGHARALLGLSDAVAQRRGGARGHRALTFRCARRKRWSRSSPRHRLCASRRRRCRPMCTRAAEDRLRFALGTKVRIVRGPSGTGSIEISFGSESELNRLHTTARDCEAAVIVGLN